jgi:hypothetical protein
VHPDVLDLTSWNGYRYWMAVTPYPYANDAYENPSIYASNDKTTWVVPDGLTNPIEPKPASGANSDPDLYFDGTALYCTWREYGNNQAIIYYIKSTDGVTWTNKTQMLTGTIEGLVSQAIVYNGTQFCMYSYNHTDKITQRRTCATLNGTWSDPVTCTITPSITGWHLDVVYSGGKYYMLIAPLAGNGLYLAMSTDGLNFARANTPIFTDARPLWCDIEYRSTLVKITNGFDVWSSGHDVNAVWKVGYSSIVKS